MSHSITQLELNRTRRDAFAVVILGAVAALATTLISVQKFSSTFTPIGVVWSVPIEAQSLTGAAPATTQNRTSTIAAVTGQATSLEVLVHNLNPFSAFSIGVALTICTITAFIMITCTVLLARHFLAATVFTVAASRAIRVLTISLAVGLLSAFVFLHFGVNGIAAALSEGSNGMLDIFTFADWFPWYAIALFLVTAFGLVDICHRRAMKLQDSTEGLV